MDNTNNTDTIKVAAIGDIHMTVGDGGRWRPVFEEMSETADVCIICGDLTDTGDEEEAIALVDEFRNMQIPVVAVLGNHDHEKGRQKTIRQILQDGQVTVLDGEATIIGSVGFAGIKGFGGGFDRYMSSMFGEECFKAFVQEAVNESILLDRALAKLEQEHPEIRKIAMMHYAPIRETIEGEPLEIYPFLGSSYLAEPIQRREVVAAFHGHAHAGQFKGKTYTGVPVYNVAVPVLNAQHHSSYYLIEV